MIQESLCDTQVPRNLHDEDFGPNSAFLPPSRPTTEVTPILYEVTKVELSAIFRTVYVRVTLGRADAYDEIMSLDRQLERARENISPRLRNFDLQDSITVSPYVMIRKFTIEKMYLKTVCMLHRHHMVLSFKNPEYSFSRLRCLNAAMATLKHQADILRHMQSGGLLHRNTMFASSIEQADFLLASMLVCVELSSRTQSPARPETANIYDLYNQHDLIKALQQSHKYLKEAKDGSVESRQAFNVLSAVLRKFSQSNMQVDPQPPSINVVPAPTSLENCKQASIVALLPLLTTS